MLINSIIHSLPGWCIALLKVILKKFNSFKFIFYPSKQFANTDRELEKNLKQYNLYRPLGPQKKICKAPFSSMYFGSNGEVTACCFNRRFQLGNYSKQSIMEIWKGTKINKLKEALLKHDFSLGCNMCQETIMSKNFGGVGAVTYDTAIINKKYPSSLKFELSNICNLSCIMCSEKYSSSFETEKLQNKNIYDDNFIEQLDEFIPHLYTASFLGGEPFLITIYYKIWERIIEFNPSCIISLQTNGTILNNKIKSLMEKGNFQLSISLDSLKKETYEIIRKNASFEDMMENFKYFFEYTKKKKTYFGISFCPIQINWEEIPDIIKFCNRNHAKLFFNYVIHPSHLTLKTLNASELKKITDFLKIARINENSSIGDYNYKQFISLENQIVSWYLSAKEFEGGFENIRHLNISEMLNIFEKKLTDFIHTEKTFSESLKSEKINRIKYINSRLCSLLQNNDKSKQKIFQLMNSPEKDIINGLNIKSDEDIISEIK